jgi:hypothetical protein
MEHRRLHTLVVASTLAISRNGRPESIDRRKFESTWQMKNDLSVDDALLKVYLDLLWSCRKTSHNVWVQNQHE